MRDVLLDVEPREMATFFLPFDLLDRSRQSIPDHFRAAYEMLGRPWDYRPGDWGMSFHSFDLSGVDSLGACAVPVISSLCRVIFRLGTSAHDHLSSPALSRL